MISLSLNADSPAIDVYKQFQVALFTVVAVSYIYKINSDVFLSNIFRYVQCHNERDYENKFPIQT